MNNPLKEEAENIIKHIRILRAWAFEIMMLCDKKTLQDQDIDRLLTMCVEMAISGDHVIGLVGKKLQPHLDITKVNHTHESDMESYMIANNPPI